MGELADLRRFLVRVPADAARALTPVPPDVGRQIAAVLVSDARRRFVTGTDPGGKKWKPLAHPRPNGGSLPLLDSGLLRASVTGVPTATGAAVFSNLPQANLHEFGGTVRPTRAKYLAIPLTREAKRAGSPRRFGRLLKFRPVKGPTAKGVLYAPPTAKGGRPVDHYLLVTEVTVPARPFLAPSASALAAVADIVAGRMAVALPR